LTTKGLFENVLHCSATEPEAENEIKLWFSPDGLTDEIFPGKDVTFNQKKRVWL